MGRRGRQVPVPCGLSYDQLVSSLSRRSAVAATRGAREQTVTSLELVDNEAHCCR